MIGAIVFFVLLFGYFGIVKGESDSLKVFLAIIGIVAVVWLIGSFSNDNNGMKKEVMSFAVVVKGGIVQQIGKGVVSRPETCFSGQPTKWAKDIYKKGHGPVPEVE